MALPDSIVRSEVASAIRDGYSGDFFDAATAESAILSAVPTVNMGTKTEKLPALASRPSAQWLTDTDNTAVKPKSKATWTDKTIVAEEVAVIIPVHEDTIADATEEVLAQIAKLGGAAIGLKLDQAVMFGTDKPATWSGSNDFAAAAAAASQVYAIDEDEEDLLGSFLIAAGTSADKGVNLTKVIAQPSLKLKLANLRGEDGHLIGGLGNFESSFDTVFSRNGAWSGEEETVGFLIDPSYIRVGVRQDISVKFLDQATLTGSNGDYISLAERDMVALRFVARFGYVLNTGLTAAGVAAAPVAAVVASGS